MEKHCQNPHCENQAIKEVPISVRKPSDQKRSLCGACEEAYSWGVQQGAMSLSRKRLWVLAIADRGMVVHGQAYGSRQRAVQGLAQYLKNNENYTGPAEMPAISDWLAEHDERLSVELFTASLDPGNKERPEEELTIEPPPMEHGSDEPLYRVVYVIDVNAAHPRDAAEYTHRIMTDPDSMRPVLHVLDSTGCNTTIDLSKD